MECRDVGLCTRNIPAFYVQQDNSKIWTILQFLGWRGLSWRTCWDYNDKKYCGGGKNMRISCGLFGLAEDMERDFWGTMKGEKLLDDLKTGTEILKEMGVK